MNNAADTLSRIPVACQEYENEKFSTEIPLFMPEEILQISANLYAIDRFNANKFSSNNILIITFMYF